MAQEEEEVHDIVIVGGGIGGLALSLALHRKGIKSLVLERSKVLRSEGAAMGVHGNGWHALDQLKIADDLRNCAIPLTGMHYEYVGKDNKNVVPYRRDFRCLKRKDLVETLAQHVPVEQLRFGCQVTSLDFDHTDDLHVLTTRDGSVIKAKVLIGCDGLHSMVARSLQLAPPNFFPLWITRSLTYYPEGHPFGNHFLRLVADKSIFGMAPIDSQNIYFFVASFTAPAGDMNDPDAVKECSIEALKGAPDEIVDAVRNCDMEILTMRQAGYIPLLALYNQNFRRGTMTVLGDAMHAMGPFIGQGGSAAIEDAIVLSRCLSNAINNSESNSSSSDKKWSERVEEALDLYVKERRLRIMRVALQSYLVGCLDVAIGTKSRVMKLAVILALNVLFGENFNHTLFECGTL